MIRTLLLICFVCFLQSCSFDRPVAFSTEAMNEELRTTSGQSLPLSEVLSQNNSQKVVLVVWASWCRDCIEGLPKISKLQQEYPSVSFVFLSLDKTVGRWKRALNKYQIKGAHYFMSSGKKGALGEFLGLYWIPRYMVLDEAGAITLFKATTIDDQRIVDAIKK